MGDYDPTETALRLQLATVIKERDRLRERIDAYEGEVERREHIDQLIAESSLGTPAARALAERTSPDAGYAILRASQEMERAEAAEAEREWLRARVGELESQAGDRERHLRDALKDTRAERDRLREALMATYAILDQPTSAPNGDYTVVPLLVAEKLAERDRLRAVVDAARQWRAWLLVPIHRSIDESNQRRAAHDALVAAVDALDVSGERATDG